ncbi:MAG: pyridoxamine 5'-phosphate oxidase family protein [Anaerolineae bacterium]
MARYHMHKSEREITDPEIIEAVLRQGKYATLALARDGEPYAVTLNYGYDPASRALYFHTATEGLKLRFIEENPAVCGTVVEDRGYVQGKCAHAYRSVVFWGGILSASRMPRPKPTASGA